MRTRMTPARFWPKSRRQSGLGGGDGRELHGDEQSEAVGRMADGRLRGLVVDVGALAIALVVVVMVVRRLVPAWDFESGVVGGAVEEVVVGDGAAGDGPGVVGDDGGGGAVLEVDDEHGGEERVAAEGDALWA